MKAEEPPILNDEQRQAVSYTGGALLLIAGAGTGKTFVIAEKVKHLIQKKKARPEEILALTFTEKSAREMEDRVDKTLPYGYFQMWISTFHSFADQILREEIAHIGLNAGYRLLTQAETVIFLRENLFLFHLRYFRPLGNPHKFIEALLQHFSRLRDEDIQPQEYLAWAKKSEDRKRNMELARAYETYQNIKIKENVFDFSDLIFYLLRLFRERKNLLKKYQKQFRYVLVDEFQDTNIAQYELIKLLCPRKNNPRLTVVGDDSQAIYKFRGASVSNILTFMRDYPKAKQITLKRNYRSSQSILDAAYRLIKHNDPDTLEAQLGISKNLVAQKKAQREEDAEKQIRFFLADRGENEADYVASEIKKLAKHRDFSDFAILVRANKHADPFLRALSQKGIPYQFLGPGVLLKQPEVKDIIAYLFFLANLEDSVSLYRVLNMDILDVNKKDIALLLSFSRKIALPLFQSLEIYLGCKFPDIFRPEFEVYKEHLPLLTSDANEKLLKIYKIMLRHLNLIRKESGGQILYYFLEDTGYLSLLAGYKTLRDEKTALNISKLFDRLKKYEIEHEDASVYTIVDFLKMSMELGESPLAVQEDIATYDAVNILTVHSAKGLEFPVVFLVNLSRDRFPTRERREAVPIPQELIKEILPKGDYHILEERRLFYVGLTRAMEKIYLTSSQFYAEGKRERKLSPFAYETLGEEFVEKSLLRKREAKRQLSIFEFKKEKERSVRKEQPYNVYSFSQLESYLTCPLRYKYQYILKIPTTPHSSASFGSTIHKALQKFYEEFMENRKIGLARLLEIYRTSWIPIGYTSATHEKQRKREGEKMLSVYFKMFHDPKLRIIDLEKTFKVKLDGIVVTGKIDRVDEIKKNEIEIIDYKTGKKPNEKNTKRTLQLLIYLLAATDKGLYNKPIDKVNLTFYYLQDMEKISMKKSAEDIVKVKENIRKTVAEIRESAFVPRVGPWCDSCPFRMICEAWQ